MNIFFTLAFTTVRGICVMDMEEMATRWIKFLGAFQIISEYSCHIYCDLRHENICQNDNHLSHICNSQKKKLTNKKPLNHNYDLC
jgi:hypothetical protein